MPSKSVVGERIRKLREKKGMTQTELAKILGVSRQAVNNYETGDAKPGDVSKVKMCQVLDCDIIELFFKE